MFPQQATCYIGNCDQYPFSLLHVNPRPNLLKTKPVISPTASSARAVSYTHLDVYKRQTCGRSAGRRRSVSQSFVVKIAVCCPYIRGGGEGTYSFIAIIHNLRKLAVRKKNFVNLSFVV